MLVGIGDHEGHLGVRGPRVALVATDRDQPAPMLHDQGQPVDVVHRGEVVDLLRGQIGMDVEVPPVDRVRRE
jgi:hypothetical protein